jgi:hypothetical protein
MHARVYLTLVSTYVRFWVILAVADVLRIHRGELVMKPSCFAVVAHMSFPAETESFETVVCSYVYSALALFRFDYILQKEICHND